MLTGDITHALTPVAGIQRIAMRAVRTATWLSVPMGGICTECMSHKAPVGVLYGGIYGMCGMLYQDMVTQECAVTAGGKHEMLTYETMTREIPAGPMLECVVLTTFRNFTLLQSKCTTREYAITTESSESANTRSECAVLEFADTVTLHIATITTSGMLTWRLQTRRIPVEQRDPWRRRIAHTCVTRVNVVTKGGSTTPPHSTVGTEGGRTTTPHTTPPPTTPPPTMERQSEPPPATEATVAVGQLCDMATLFMKCQVLAFFEAIWTFSLYILYCEPLGDKKGVGHTMHYGPWRWP